MSKTVLRKILKCACSLTSASRGVIATVDDKGAVLEFIKVGFSNEEHLQIARWTDAPRLFEHVLNLSGPVRVTNIQEWAGEMGLTTDPLGSYAVLGMPLGDRGLHVGRFFVGDKKRRVRILRQ